MNRGQALHFLTALTADEVSRLGSGVKNSEENERVRRAFLDCFPARFPDEPVFERLSRPIDEARWRAFEGRVAQSPLALWLQLRLEAARQPAPVKSEPVLRVRPGAAEALALMNTMRRLGGCVRLAASDQLRFEQDFLALIDAWGEEVQPYTDDGRCPDCNVGYLLELDASRHLRACTGHPAVVRLRGAQAAARLLGLDAPADVQLPAEQPSAYGQRWEAKSALERLLSSRGATEEAVQRASLLLERVAREWAHFVDRSTDPCPWCGGVFPLEAYREHLRGCARHPAAQVQVSERVPSGLVLLVQRRMVARHELALLSGACTTFDGDMGWTGEAAYSDKYSEAPWRAAIARAAKYLGLGERQRAKALGPSALSAATRCLLSKTPVPAADQRAAIATLREAVKKHDEWTKDFDFGATCPACQRKGLPRAHLAKHLEMCPLHPAVRGARARAAIDTLHTGVEGSRLTLGQYDPEDYRDRSGDSGRQQRDNAVRKLITFDPSELSADEVRTLTWFVSDWEELEAIAQPPPCPWCGTSKPGEAHFLQCAKHPARGAEGPWDGLEATAARLQHEADQLEVRLARLHEACCAFWNGMRDGEDGKSISNDRIEAMWATARTEAKDLLQSLPV